MGMASRKRLSKNTGMPSRNALPQKATGARLSPMNDNAPRTMRSAAPLASRQRPMTHAIAMRMPILPAVEPKASVMRLSVLFDCAYFSASTFALDS